MPAPIVMVHGAFCGGWTFDRFRIPFEAAGHRVTALDLPGHGPGSRSVAGFSMSDYAKAVSAACSAETEPPILIGHSIGGLVAQMAAAKTRLSGLILLAPSSPWGIAGSSMEEGVQAVSLYALGPFWTLAIEPDYASAAMYSIDRLSRDDRKALFARMIPESGRALWETLNWWLDPFMTTSIPARSVKAPVLAIAGARDAIHPPATVKQIADRLGGQFQSMAGMSHWLPGEPGWEDVAAFCLDWIATRDVVSAA